MLLTPEELAWIPVLFCAMFPKDRVFTKQAEARKVVRHFSAC